MIMLQITRAQPGKYISAAEEGFEDESGPDLGSSVSLTSSSKVRLPLRAVELTTSGRNEWVAEYVALDGTEFDIELARGGTSSPSNPPTSKKDIRRGVRIDTSRGLGGLSPLIAETLRSNKSDSTESLPGNPQLGCAGVIASAGEAKGKTAGAGRGTLGLSWANSGPSLYPISLTRSLSLPQLKAALGLALATLGRSKLLPLVLLNRNRCFFAPRSRTNEPRTSALETPAAARISNDASRERNCWL